MINLSYLIGVTGSENVRITADGSIEIIDNSGNVRLATSDEIISVKRLQLRDDINAERKRREALGLLYVFPDGISGTVQMRNATDFRNIAGLTSAATILTMQGVSDPVLWFTDAENIPHALTPAQMLLLGITVQKRISALYAAAAEIKTALAIADPDSFDITAGWPD